jgi:hypothetical protein
MGNSLSVFASGSAPTGAKSRQRERGTLRRADLFNSLEINKTAANYITAHGRRKPD